MNKIRYRLVFNRKNRLNRQGEALVQIEASLENRRMYMSTRVYVSPTNWSAERSCVVNHPLANDLNAILYEDIIRLQTIEVGLWKMGIQPSLGTLREELNRNMRGAFSFIDFCLERIRKSDRKESTKKNLLTTVHALDRYKRDVTFQDLTYSFIKDFAFHLKETGMELNTVGKHLRQIKTLIAEAVNHEYIPSSKNPFRQIKIPSERKDHRFLTASELKMIEQLSLENEELLQVQRGFLFCCYTGLRYSDFCSIKKSCFCKKGECLWLVFKTVKTNHRVELPLTYLFGGKPVDLLGQNNLDTFFKLPENGETNRKIKLLCSMVGIEKYITFHSSRHSFATNMLNAGISITTIQKLLGHASINTTQVYSEVLNEAMLNELKYHDNEMK